MSLKETKTILIKNPITKNVFRTLVVPLSEYLKLTHSPRFPKTVTNSNNPSNVYMEFLTSSDVDAFFNLPNNPRITEIDLLTTSSLSSFPSIPWVDNIITQVQTSGDSRLKSELLTLVYGVDYTTLLDASIVPVVMQNKGQWDFRDLSSDTFYEVSKIILSEETNFDSPVEHVLSILEKKANKKSTKEQNVLVLQFDFHLAFDQVIEKLRSLKFNWTGKLILTPLNAWSKCEFDVRRNEVPKNQCFKQTNPDVRLSLDSVLPETRHERKQRQSIKDKYKKSL